MHLRKKPKVIRRRPNPKRARIMPPFLKRTLIRAREVFGTSRDKLTKGTAAMATVERVGPKAPHWKAGKFLGMFIDSNTFLATHKYYDSTKEYEKLNMRFIIRKKEGLNIYIDPIRVQQRKTDKK